MVIVYRKDATDEWHEIQFERYGLWNIGYLYVDVMVGEYAFAVWDKTYVGVSGALNNDQLNIFPNPSDSGFNINFNSNNYGMIEIYNEAGTLVDNISICSGQRSIKWNPINLPAGNYFVNLTSDNKILARQKMVYTK